MPVARYQLPSLYLINYILFLKTHGSIILYIVFRIGNDIYTYIIQNIILSNFLTMKVGNLIKSLSHTSAKHILYMNKHIQHNEKKTSYE